MVPIAAQRVGANRPPRASVKGDFSLGQVRLRGDPYRLRVDKGVFYIAESYFSKEPRGGIPRQFHG